jgi:hypothetical protein
VTTPPSDDPVRHDDVDRAMRVFPRVTTAVADARDWLTAFLRAHSMQDGVVEDAVLVTSELVTNALRHGLGDVVVRTPAASSTARSMRRWSGSAVVCVLTGSSVGAPGTPRN